MSTFVKPPIGLLTADQEAPESPGRATSRTYEFPVVRGHAKAYLRATLHGRLEVAPAPHLIDETSCAAVKVPASAGNALERLAVESAGVVRRLLREPVHRVFLLQAAD